MTAISTVVQLGRRSSTDSTSSPAMIKASASSSGASTTSTSSRSQLRVIFTVAASSELSQKAQVVLIEEANVGDAVLQHRHALDSHAERKARDRLGIVTDGAEHLGMDEAGSENFEPPRRLAHATRIAVREPSRAATDHTADVHLRTRLGERKEARTE